MSNFETSMHSSKVHFTLQYLYSCILLHNIPLYYYKIRSVTKEAKLPTPVNLIQSQVKRKYNNKVERMWAQMMGYRITGANNHYSNPLNIARCRPTTLHSISNCFYLRKRLIYSLPSLASLRTKSYYHLSAKDKD